MSGGSSQFPPSMAARANMETLLRRMVDDLDIIVLGGGGGGGATTANQGTPSTMANAWPVVLSTGVVPFGTFSAPIRTDPTGSTVQPVSAASLPLPTGAASDANLTTLITALTARLNTLGQHLAAASASVVLASDQPAIPVTGPLTDAELRAAAVPVSGPLTDAQLRASAVAVSAANLPLPAGASTEATLAAIKAKTDNLDVALSTRAVTGLTDTQLRASAVPVSAASLPLPSGAATEATLATRVADATVTARLGTLGQKAMVGSAPVVIASDQSAIPVSGTVAVSGTVPVSAVSLPLPSGAATEATLAVAKTDLDTLVARQPVLGAAVTAASSPVNIASDQVVPVSASALPLPSGAATEATLVTRAADVTLTGGAQRTKVTDGTTNAAVKAASTAAVAADTALVVAISPNNTLPVSPTSGETTIHNNATVSASGSVIISNVSGRMVSLDVSVVNSPTGVSPTIKYTVSGLRADGTNATNETISTQTFTDINFQLVSIPVRTPNVLVTWTVTGTWTGVYARLVPKAAALAGLDTVTDAEYFLAADPDGNLSFAAAAGTGTPVSVAVIGANTVGGFAEPAQAHDLDSGAGSEFNLGVSLRTVANGGSVEAGTAAHPLHAVLDSLPTNAATESTLSTVASQVTLINGHQTDGTQKSIVRGGAKGATVATDVTSTAEGADHQALDVQLYSGATAINPQTIRALTSADVVTAAQGTAAAASGAWPAKVTDGTNVSAVKAASTAALATDPALVVAISPNNTPVLPSGASTETTLVAAKADLDTIAARTPALGQAAMASSSPVVIASNQTAVPAAAADGFAVNQPLAARLVGPSVYGLQVAEDPRVIRLLEDVVVLLTNLSGMVRA